LQKHAPIPRFGKPLGLAVPDLFDATRWLSEAAE